MDRVTLIGSFFMLRELNSSDADDEYLSWLRDPEVNKFLTVRHNVPNLEELQDFISSFDRVSKILWGIFDRHSNKKIGTISIHIDSVNHRAYYGYMIGNRDYWGTKAGVTAIALMLDFTFNIQGVVKVWGCANVRNLGSIFNFKKLGFSLDNEIPTQVVFENGVSVYSISKAHWAIYRLKFLDVIEDSTNRSVLSSDKPTLSTSS